MHRYDNLILGNGAIFSMNCNLTQTNNNVCVIGASGSGKSHSVVKPNMLETSNTSLIISDPKGALEKEFKNYYRNRGYKVYSVDLINPGESFYGFNFMSRISCEQDFVKIAHRIVYADRLTRISTHQDPYWNNMCEMLLSALIALVYMTEKEGNENFARVMQYLPLITRSGNDIVNMMFEEIEEAKGDCFAVSQWKKFRAVSDAEKTWACVMSSLSAILTRYGTSEIKAFFENKNQVDFEKLAMEKSVLFFKVSDTDDTYYNLANILYGQALESLCNLADSLEEGKCPFPVRFILDDFATNVIIEGMPRIISTIRARDISVMIILQSLHQLQRAYGEEAATIIANCDSLVFCGSNDLQTAEELSRRLDKPLTDILYQKRGIVSIFRAGMFPMQVSRYDYRTHKNYHELCKTIAPKFKVSVSEQEIDS